MSIRYSPAIPQCSSEQIEPIVLFGLLVDICAVLTGCHCTFEVVSDQETWEQGQKENSAEITQITLTGFAQRKGTFLKPLSQLLSHVQPPLYPLLWGESREGNILGGLSNSTRTRKSRTDKAMRVGVLCCASETDISVCHRCITFFFTASEIM